MLPGGEGRRRAAAGEAGAADFAERERATEDRTSAARRKPIAHFSATACLMRWIGGADCQPKAWRRKRAVNSHL